MPEFQGRVVADHGEFVDLEGLTVSVLVRGEPYERVPVAPDGTFSLSYKDPDARLVVDSKNSRLFGPARVPNDAEGPMTIELALQPRAFDRTLSERWLALDPTLAGEILEFIEQAQKRGWASPAQAERVAEVLREADAFMGLAEAAAIGVTGAIERLGPLLDREGFTDLGLFRPLFPGGLDGAGCRTALRASASPALAAIGLGKEGVGRAVTAYVRRAEAIERLGKLATMKLDDSAEAWTRAVLDDVIDLAGPEGAGRSLPELLGREGGHRERLKPAQLLQLVDPKGRLGNWGAGSGRFPVPPGPFGPDWPPIGFGKLDLCQLQWMECVDVVTRPPVVNAPAAPTVDRVEPNAFCQGGGTVTLWPGPGGFPAQQPADVRLLVGIPSAQVTWASNRIDVTVPAGTPPGCYPLAWEILLGNQMLELAQGRSACDPFFLPSGWTTRPPLLTQVDIDHVLVAGPPTARLSSRGQVLAIEAPGCTPVVVNWLVGSGFENTACRAKLVLEASIDLGDGAGWRALALDEAALRRGSPFYVGEVTVQAADDREVLLESRLLINGQQCHSTQSRFMVRRYQELRLTAPPLVSEGPFDVRVDRSCPAPAGGVNFALSSTAPGVIGSAMGNIAAGATSATVSLNAATCGDTVLQVGATDHRGSSAGVQVRGTPEVLSLVPNSAVACSQTTVTLTLRCAGPNPTLEVQGPAGPTPVTLRRTPGSAGSDPWGTVSYSATLPGLPPGMWPLVVRSSEGRASRPSAASTLTVSPSPVALSASTTIVNPLVAPGAVLSGVPACLGGEVQIRIEASGATELIVQLQGGAQVARRTRPIQCGRWVETVSRVAFRAETYEITANGPGGTQTLVRAVSAMRRHPFAVGGLRVVNASSSDVFALVTLIDPTTGQNVPIELGTVAARSIETFDSFIDDKKVPECTPIVCWVLLDKSYLPIQTNFRGVVAQSPSPAATVFRTVDGADNYVIAVNDTAVAGALR